MKKWIWILSGVVGMSLIFFWFWYPERPMKNVPIRQTGPIVFLGDSLVEGVGATSDHDMPSLLTQALGEPVLNYGVAGDTTARARTRLEPILGRSPRLTLVLLGGNDFLQKVPREQIKNNLVTIVTELQSTGSAVLLLGVRSGIVSGGSDEFYEEIANQTESAYEEDILQGVFGNPQLMSDAIHPNNLGYAKIVNERLLPAMKRLLDEK